MREYFESKIKYNQASVTNCAQSNFIFRNETNFKIWTYFFDNFVN